MAFPGGSDGKEFAWNSGDLSSIPGLGRSPAGGHDYSLQYSCLEDPHGHRSLAGYSPWGRKGSGTTKVTKHTHTSEWKNLPRKLSPLSNKFEKCYMFYPLLWYPQSKWEKLKPLRSFAGNEHVSFWLVHCSPKLFKAQELVLLCNTS